jgi:polysaccharide pyruvyl transferase WcaK-like protein
MCVNRGDIPCANEATNCSSLCRKIKRNLQPAHRSFPQVVEDCPVREVFPALGEIAKPHNFYTVDGFSRDPTRNTRREHGDSKLLGLLTSNVENESGNSIVARCGECRREYEQVGRGTRLFGDLWHGYTLHTRRHGTGAVTASSSRRRGALHHSPQRKLQFTCLDHRCRVRVLIHNSDSPYNQGDRAILAGVIQVVRDRWPDAEIWSLSQFVERDERWFGIRFLEQSPYSLNPLHWLRLLRAARSADIVLWGGGEILKDYTNRLGLRYWKLKVRLLRLANKRIIGVWQGIGPTGAASSRRLIATTVNLTESFIVRDEESRQRLITWGVTVPVISSFDPAVVGTPAPFDDEVRAALAIAQLSEHDLENSIGFGVRRWFHYSHGGLIPYRFRRRTAEGPRLIAYRRSLADVADRLAESTAGAIVFFPMHSQVEEGDASFAREVISHMRYAHRARVLDPDALSAAQYASVMSRMSVFVASRLHSAILATTAAVPAFVLYYVDKGRVFFEQLGLERLSEPIETLLESGRSAVLADRILALRSERQQIRAVQAAAIAKMSAHLRTSLAVALGETAAENEVFIGVHRDAIGAQTLQHVTSRA